MKIAVLLSGGVDSSVALALLKEQGHDVTAFYLKIWLEDEMSYLGSCPWEEDLEFAQKTCDVLDVELKVVPLQREYHDRVVSYTIETVEQGLTPNPDMHCNREVKFGAFYEKYGHEFDFIATGHYAQIEHQGNQTVLQRAVDPVKDQTYFLAMMSAAQLSHALFPIGSMPKSEVRQLAQEYGLPTAKRKDSQGICFLGKISFADFIRHHLGTRPGKFVEKETGAEVGDHEGFYFYTIGQRRGVEVSNGPWYVCDKDPEKNIVYITHGFSGEDQARTEFDVTGMNWIMQSDKKDLQVKLRHGPEHYDCRIETINDGAHVTLERSDRSVTPGQYAVLYDGDICLGGGVIV